MGDGAAVRTGDQPLLLEHAQIATHGRGGHAQLLGQVADADRPIGRELLHDPAQSLRLAHGAPVYGMVALDGCLLSDLCLKSPNMRAIDQEVASQPEMWRRAIELAPAAHLPASGLRLAVAGCGTSLYVAQAYAAAREAAGAGETDAWAASEFPQARTYDALLAITRSGTTTEVLDLLRASRGACEKYHGAVIGHAGRGDTRVFREVAELGAEFERLGGAVLGARTPARVALLFDWDSWWAIEQDARATMPKSLSGPRARGRACPSSVEVGTAPARRPAACLRE